MFCLNIFLYVPETHTNTFVYNLTYVCMYVCLYPHACICPSAQLKVFLRIHVKNLHKPEIPFRVQICVSFRRQTDKFAWLRNAWKLNLKCIIRPWATSPYLVRWVVLVKLLFFLYTTAKFLFLFLYVMRINCASIYIHIGFFV